MLATLTKPDARLDSVTENMARNCSVAGCGTRKLVLALIRKGLTREAAYELVQRKNAMEDLAGQTCRRKDADFLKQLLSDPEWQNTLAKASWIALFSRLSFQRSKQPLAKLGL